MEIVTPYTIFLFLLLTYHSSNEIIITISYTQYHIKICSLYNRERKLQLSQSSLKFSLSDFRSSTTSVV
jgi:hypothetical protein